MIHSLERGGAKVDVLLAGTIKHDAGVTFGAVPRAIWKDLAEADGENRIDLTLRPVLVRTGGGTYLVDAGLGNHQNARMNKLFSLRGDGTPLASLERLGVAPEEVDAVLFTHLHVDHLGGAVNGEGTIFPRAAYVAQKGEWETATRTNALTRGAYSRADLERVEESGRLRLVEGDAEPYPGIRLVPTGGHTRFHQMVLVGEGEETVMLPGDLLPSTYHFRLPYIAAVDLNREDTFLQKARWMKRAADGGWTVALYHETGVPAGRIVEVSHGRYELERPDGGEAAPRG
jgi:glyoxylase-like metal-dependent hydrolase (beta-lactamase superfamily II)